MIDDLQDVYLNFFVAKSLGYDAKVKHKNDTSICYVGTNSFDVCNSVGYATKNLIPHLVVEQDARVYFMYCKKYVECTIVSPEGVWFCGYGASISDSLARAFVIFSFNEQFIPIVYDELIH
jgi:hypothetical protein